MNEVSTSQAWVINGTGDAGIFGPVAGSLRYQSNDVEWQKTEATGFWVKPRIASAGKGPF